MIRLSKPTYTDRDSYLGLIDKLSQSMYGVDACDIPDDSDAAVDSLRDSWSNDEPPATAIRNVRMIKARELWAEFGDVPVNDVGEIDEPFLVFVPGTDRKDIWHWFEEQFYCSVAKDLMKLEG